MSPCRRVNGWYFFFFSDRYDHVFGGGDLGKGSQIFGNEKKRTHSWMVRQDHREHVCQRFGCISWKRRGHLDLCAISVQILASPRNLNSVYNRFWALIMTYTAVYWSYPVPSSNFCVNLCVIICLGPPESGSVQKRNGKIKYIPTETPVCFYLFEGLWLVGSQFWR